MNYIQTGITVLGIPIILAGLTSAPHAQLIAQTSAEDFYNQGVSRTHREDYLGAIADLQTAANLFSRQGNATNAYKSKALSIYLQFVAKRLQPVAVSEPNTEWYKLGQCLGTPTCQYGITWVAPEAEKTTFGGILILEKNLRMINRLDGSGEPVDAVLDVQVIPKLRSGEWLNTNCQINGKADSEVLAIVQVKGYENADLYTQVRQAWRSNLRTQKIETIPTKNVACINHCPGGC